ncbi:hypothetical protein BC629DRAFT_1075150 [Irpex lacteus]|nr:hypothetical protein BC629DRAFT_1075150 [Irpex lacteus]
MAPVLEIFRAIGTDRFRSEGVAAAREAFDILNKADGHFSSYFGTEVQDPEKFYGAILWETVGHHKALLDNKDVAPTMAKSIGQIAAKFEFVQHTFLSTSTPEDSLNAPITEFVFWDLKEDTDKEEFKGLLSELIDKILASDAVKNRGGWGSVVENDRRFAVVLGWNSKEVHARSSFPLPGRVIDTGC